MKNQVLEVLIEEHGKKVIEYWKSIGINTSVMMGVCTKKGGDLCRYYGVINGEFDNYEEASVIEYNSEIIELPEEKVYPRVMMVSNDENHWRKRVVFMEKLGKYFAWYSSESLEEAKNDMFVASWDFAKYIEEPKEFTITLSDINCKMDDIKKLFGAE